MKVKKITKKLRKEIRKIIRTKRLSYGQISEISGISKTTVYRFIHDIKVIPKVKNISVLINFMDKMKS